MGSTQQDTSDAYQHFSWEAFSSIGDQFTATNDLTHTNTASSVSSQAHSDVVDSISISPVSPEASFSFPQTFAYNSQSYQNSFGGRSLDTLGSHTPPLPYGPPSSQWSQSPSPEPDAVYGSSFPDSFYYTPTSRPQTYPPALHMASSGPSLPRPILGISQRYHQQHISGDHSPMFPMSSSPDSNRPQPTSAPSQWLRGELSNSANYHLGSTESSRHFGDWMGQSRTVNDRVGPIIDTQHLSAPSTSPYASPGSATSTRSSTGISRRNKAQLLSGRYQHTCHICNAGFSAKADLKHHLETHQPYELRPYRCPACQQRFRYPKDLVRHVQTHNADAPRHYCPATDCRFRERGFVRQDHLRRHMRTQHGWDSNAQGMGAAMSGEL